MQLPTLVICAVSESDPPIPVAAVLDDGSVDTDALLRDFAFGLQARGVPVRGLVMMRRGPDLSCATDMVLVDVHTRDEYLVSQPMGSGSTSCRVDPRGFAAASQVLRMALQAGAPLVVCDRFGGLEAAGGGFCAELLGLMAAGIPVLTVVSVPRVAAWQAFTGGTQMLPPTPGALEEWARSSLARPGDLLPDAQLSH